MKEDTTRTLFPLMEAVQQGSIARHAKNPNIDAYVKHTLSDAVYSATQQAIVPFRI